MRKSFTLASVFLILSVCMQAQSWQSSCNGTPDRYGVDIFKLSLERLQETGSPWKDSIDFPQIYKDTIAKAFYAFANMEDSPYKDTVLSAFGGISGAPFYDAPSYLGTTVPAQDSSSIFNLFQSVRYFSVSVSNSADWADAWAAGNYFTTPNATVNKLMKNYVMSVSVCAEQFCISSTSQKFYTLKTNRPLNTTALVSAFQALPNVPDARPQPYFGGGNEMAVEFATNGLTLAFINNCAECESGCNVSIAWIFRANVFSNCQMDLVYVTPHYPIPPNGGLGAPCNGCFTTDGKYYTYPCMSIITLPVSMSALTAAVKNSGAIELAFTALTQTDARYYEIQRSLDGIMYSQLATLTPITISSSQAYSYTDNRPNGNKNYYRVKVVENNGNYFYSNIATGSIAGRPPAFAIQPNPATGFFRVSVADASTLNRAVLVINSAEGRLIQQLPLQKLTTQNVNISGLASGIYWIAIHTSTGTQVQKLVVE